MNLQSRRATAEDAETISAILLKSFEEFRPLYTDGGFAATTPSADVIRQRVLEEGPSWLALMAGVPVGTVSAVEKGGSLYIRSMGVLSSARGHGIAAELLQVVEEYGRVLGVRSYTLSTTPFLHSAIRLYERFGFKRTDDPPHELFGTPLFTMKKEAHPNAALSKFA